MECLFKEVCQFFFLLKVVKYQNTSPSNISPIIQNTSKIKLFWPLPKRHFSKIHNPLPILKRGWGGGGGGGGSGACHESVYFYINQLNVHFLWIRSLRGVTLLINTKSPSFPGAHLINLGIMIGWVNLRATKWFWKWISFI